MSAPIRALVRITTTGIMRAQSTRRQHAASDKRKRRQGVPLTPRIFGIWRGSVSVMIGFEGALRLNPDVGRLIWAQLGELSADLREVEHCDLLVEVLRQRIDLLVILAVVREQLDLSER